MASKMVLAWRDFDRDKQQVGYTVKSTITIADMNPFVTIFNNWSGGAPAGSYFNDEFAADGGLASTNVTAQSRSQAILELQDAVTGSIFHARLPFPNMLKADDVGANPAYVVSGGYTVFNPAHADYATLKTEVEDNLANPDTGNAVLLNRVYLEE